MDLFKQENTVGIFRGFSKGGLEFHADLILSYKNEFQSTPMHGQFVLVQLETEDEAVLGRITSISSDGRLSSSIGEDYGLRAVADGRPIPEDLRDQYLKYRVDIRVLGVIRVVDRKLVFAASHRRLPHIGSKVAFPSNDVFQELAGHNLAGAELGFFALGEFIFSGNDDRINVEPWMQIKNPKVIPHFSVQSLVSRRSFVFARAGFGKSNLVKLLFSNLYKETPTVEKRGGKKVPVGTIIFDPDGEYYWPDDKNRPGFCDVPHLKDKIVVFTKKKGPSDYYQSFVASDIKLDIRRLRPNDVISIALPPEKQDQQNVGKLKGLSEANWQRLVNEIYRNGNAAEPNTLRELLHLDERQDAELVAARSNMTAIVRMLHDPSSQMMDMLLYSLKEGKICIVDVSQMRGTPALILSGLILQKIFDHNQEEFTKAQPETIPTLAVVEEAQSVLGNTGSSGEKPYIAWVKEGRKYDLGSVLITQQPGSISQEILSQGDNWFVFHLISSGDLQALKKANAHFSDDLLSSLLNEPIEGNGIFWSSVGNKKYPISTRILSFELLYKTFDDKYNKPAAETYAKKILEAFSQATKTDLQVTKEEDTPSSGEGSTLVEEPVDFLEKYTSLLIETFKKDEQIQKDLKESGIPWMRLQGLLKSALPTILDEQEQGNIAYRNVVSVMNNVFGKEKWDTERREKKDKSGQTTWIILK